MVVACNQTHAVRQSILMPIVANCHQPILKRFVIPMKSIEIPEFCGAHVNCPHGLASCRLRLVGSIAALACRPDEPPQRPDEFAVPLIGITSGSRDM